MQVKQLNNFFIILIVLTLFNFFFIHPSLADPCIPNSNNDSDCEGPLNIDSGINITNSGNISTSTADADAYGIDIVGNDNTITNSGTITATTITGDAYGIFSTGDNNQITNSGTITATSTNGTAYGIFSTGDNNQITNSGNISTLTADADTYGIVSDGSNNQITNSGTIEAFSLGVGDANGIYSNAYNTITNSGTIISQRGYNAGDAYGIYINAYNEIINSGTIEVYSLGVGSTYGIYGNDNNIITNSGIIRHIPSSASSEAFGIATISNNTITNSGTIEATTDTGDAYGIDIAGNENTITNSGTITATTVTGYAVGINYDIYGAGNDNTITNSGTITATTGTGDAYGIYLLSGNNNTITNSGTIEATTDTGDAYGIDIAGNENTITNSGTITATTVTGDAYGIDIARGANDNTITNSGTITVTANGVKKNAYGINNSYADNGNTIANSGTITVTSNNGYAFGIDVHNAQNYIITNSGTITSIVTTGDDGAYGVAITSIYDEGHVFTNSGRIDATGAGYSIGIDINGNYNEILNSGTITSTSTATEDIDLEGYYQYAWGILSDGDYNTITNSGTITATSADTFAFGIVFDSPFPEASDHNVIINSGTITVSTSGVGDYASGIYGEGNNNQITNSGTIKAISNNGTSTGIDLIGNNNIITNSGKIIANEAILFEGGSNTLNIQPNSYISGIITLPGDTTVNITTGPSHSIYYNLGVTPTFSGPTSGFINGTKAAAFDPTVFKGSINELADLNNNIASATNKNLSNFKDRQFSTSVFASQLEHKADTVNLKQEIDQLGVVFAYDYKLADTNINFMAGYANSDLEASSRFAKSYNNKSKGPFIGVAGIYDAGLVNVNFGLTTGLLKHSHDRFVNDNEATNGEAHAKANYDSMFMAPEIGVSKKIKSNDITFSPKANVRYNYQSVDGYTETGSNSNATVKSLDVGLVETNLEVAGTKSLNKSSYTIKTGYLNRQSVGDHKATVTMIGQTNSIGFGDKSNNIYYAGVGADLNLANFKLSFDLNQYLGDAEGVQGMVKLSSSF